MGNTMDYDEFLENKAQTTNDYGFEPIYDHDFLFDFQKDLLLYATKKGRAAIFADCGLGKTPIQLSWADNIVRKTNKNVLIVTPLAVSPQTVREGDKFGIECKRSIIGEINSKITVTNYERLHYFNPNDFIGVVCDESSAIKAFTGQRRKIVTEFMRKMPYRLLCTATASPNDYVELGTSSEALGYMGYMDMLSTFFKTSDNAMQISQRYGDFWNKNKWRFKAHSKNSFWRWVCSWARAIRKPSDMGYDDMDFILPKLTVNEIVCEHNRPFDGELFVRQAVTLQEQRLERHITLQQRCEMVAEKVSNHDCSLVWCHSNEEGDLLSKIIPDSKQISGKDTDDYKEKTFSEFSYGDLPVLITKPQIGAFGLNFQHCAHITFFPSHSFEQYYQGVRRCWRFGQKRPVTVDIITTTGELKVLKNLQRKTRQADSMFEELVKFMNDEKIIKQRAERNTKQMEMPTWMK